MILDREHWEDPMLHSLDRSVVEVNMGEPKARCTRYFIPYPTPDCEAVVLRGDLDCLPFKELDWVVPTMMPEREFEGPCPKRTTDELMT